MRYILHLSLLALAAYGYNEPAPMAPQTEKVEPRVGKPGTIIKIWGRALDKSHVDEVYLTDHRFDMKVKVLEQSAGQITVRVPPFVKPGRLQLLLLTAGKSPVYLEQPWFVLIEASDEETIPTPPPVEVSQKTKPTVEVAASGSSMPVPLAGAPPSPATMPGLEKSLVPLKTPVETAKPVAAAAPVIPQTVLPAVSPAPSPVAAPPVPAGDGQTHAGTIPAQVIRRTRINYPAAALSQRIEGTVEVVAIVKADGRVKDIRVVRGNPLLIGAALSSVSQWLYEPAYVQGRPVESEVPITLSFKRP